MTDPARMTRKDPGTPEICNIYALHQHFSPPDTVAEVAGKCRTAGWGCLDCKRVLADNMAADARRRSASGPRSWPAEPAPGRRRCSATGRRRPGRSRRGDDAGGASAGWASSRPGMMPRLACDARSSGCIKAAVERGASDLHIKAGDVFRARIDGKLVPLTKQRLTPEQTRADGAQADRQRRGPRPASTRCGTSIAPGECRGWGGSGSTCCASGRRFMIVMRVIPFAVPTLEELRAAREVLRLWPSADAGWCW